MIAFILACAGLVLFSALFYLLPHRVRNPGEDEREESNLEWYRLRRSELTADDDEALVHDMQLRLLEDMPTGLKSPDGPGADAAARDVGASAQRFPAWILLPLVAIVSGSLYYLLGAAPDVQIKAKLVALTEQSTPQQMQFLMTAIERRSEQRPANMHYRALLGRYYMAQEDYRQAAATYSALVEEAPGDAQALAFAAQAQYLANDRTLNDQAQMLAEQSLAIDPHQRTALGLLGMASFERGQYRPAIEYWQRLMAMEPAGSEAALMIAGVVERARERLAEATGTAPEPIAAPAVTPGVTIRVSLPAGAQIAATDTVFVLARAASSDSRMPIAVQRLQGADLPAVLRLDDSMSMAGQKLSEAESIVVIVQVSPDGQPGEANATWLGNAGPLAPSLDIEPLEIELRSSM